MRALVVDPSLFTRPYDQAFCSALAAAGAEVRLVARPLRPHEELAATGFAYEPLFYRRSERGRGEAVSGIAAKLLKGLEHAWGLAALARLIRRTRPDVVHLQWLVLPLLDDLAYAHLAREVPMVLTLHDSVAFHGRPSSALQTRGYERALRRFARYIAHTRQTVRYLEGLGVPSARISLLSHPPLDLPAAAPAASPKIDDTVRILLFGELKPYKGIDVLVEAGLALAGRRQDFRIEIAGRAFLPLDGLQAELAAAGAADRFAFDLRFLPEAELAAKLAAADIVVFPYREIDASGALTLAIGSGRPIVASAVGVFAEPPVASRIRLVPPGDATALAQALDELIGDPGARAALAAGSRELAGTMPGWPAFASACLDIYRELPVPAGR